MKIQKQINIELTRKGFPQTIDLVQYDTGIQLIFCIKDFTIPEGTTAALYVQKPSGKFVYQETGITITGNTVTVDLKNQAITEYGKIPYQISLENGSDSITTFAGILDVERRLKDAAAEESKTVVSSFKALTAEQIAEIKAATQTQIGVLQGESQKQQNEIIETGKAVNASIPEDYTALDAEVKALRKELDVSAPAITQPLSGTEIIATDSADKPFVDFALDGKGEQVETKGYQLFDASKLPTTTAGGATVTNNGDGSFTVSGSGALTNTFNKYASLTHEESLKLLKTGKLYLNVVYGNIPYFYVNVVSGTGNISSLSANFSTTDILQTWLDDEQMYLRFGFFGSSGTTITPGTIKPMLYQDGDGTWEPFTGGNPSPSPEYPQEIVNVGRMYNLCKPLVKGIHINPNSGIEYENTATASTDYIDADFVNNTYYLSGLNSNLYSFVGFYDTEKMYLGRTHAGANDAMLIKDRIDTTTISIADIAYMRLTTYESSTLTGTIDLVDSMEVMLNEGTTDLPYRPYTGMYETEVVVRGKNWFSWSNSESVTSDGITALKEIDTSEMILNGIGDTVKNDFSFILESSLFLSAGTYTMSVHGLNEHDSYNDRLILQKQDDSSVVANFIQSGHPVTFALVKDTVLRLSAVCKKGTSYNNKTVKIQIEPGSVATEYEPYKEPQTAIITTPEPLRASKDGAYKDRVHLDGHVERQIKEVVFDGSDDEDIVRNSDNENEYLYYFTLYGARKLKAVPCLCNCLMEKSVALGHL